MRIRSLLPALLAGWCGLLMVGHPATADEPEAVAIGERMELFVDDGQVERLDGVRLKLHPPRQAEVALTFDRPWEGEHAGYVTVFQDGDRFRMYYRGWGAGKPELTCYAESRDGVRWTRPELGLFEWDGSKENNIVWHTGYGSHNFTPFKDQRPGVPDDERYKALGGKPRAGRGLQAFASADGIQWRPLQDEPVLTKGAFDSQNLAFWDPNRNQYVSYYRIFVPHESQRVRAIALATSDDFRTWSDPQEIDLGDTPREHFYTNATIPYFRAPHYYFAFPKRYVPDRRKLPDHSAAGISDAVLLTSRDGERFDRTFLEALIRPGRERHNWGDRSTMAAWGLLQTAPDEMSIYYSQGYRTDAHHLRRGVFRLDGIASAHADAKGGELVTKPFRFEGSRLMLNYSTSAAGSVRVEIQDADGQPIDGYSLDDAPELYGDEIGAAYSWTGGQDVSRLAGRPVRLRFVLKDCDLYSYRFAKTGP